MQHILGSGKHSLMLVMWLVQYPKYMSSTPSAGEWQIHSFYPISIKQQTLETLTPGTDYTTIPAFETSCYRSTLRPEGFSCFPLQLRFSFQPTPSGWASFHLLGIHRTPLPPCSLLLRSLGVGRKVHSEPDRFTSVWATLIILTFLRLDLQLAEMRTHRFIPPSSQRLPAHSSGPVSYPGREKGR